MRKKKRGPVQIIVRTAGALICLGGVGLLAWYLWNEYTRPFEVYYTAPLIVREPAEPEPEETEPPELTLYYPVGRLIESEERKAYAGGEMWLYIPRLDLKLPVYDGVDEQTLAMGVGLFDNAQLPGTSPLKNSNVCIAGHRDIHNMEFYYIDTMEEGDKIYLAYRQNLYTYEVAEVFVTHAYDWDPIRVRDFSCVTLQSCTPIGVGTSRIFVVGRLLEVEEDADFPDGDGLLAQASSGYFAQDSAAASEGGAPPPPPAPES